MKKKENQSANDGGAMSIKSMYFRIMKEGEGPSYWKELLAEVRANIFLAFSDDVEAYINTVHDIEVYLDALCAFAEKHFFYSLKEDIYHNILYFMRCGTRCKLGCVIGKENEHLAYAEMFLNLIYDEIEAIGREKFNDFEKLK